MTPTAWLVRNLERLIEELEYYAVRTSSLDLFLCYKDGRTGRGKASPLVPSDKFDQLLEAAKLAFGKALIPNVPATRMHLTATKLKWSAIRPKQLQMATERCDASAKSYIMMNHD